MPTIEDKPRIHNGPRSGNRVAWATTPVHGKGLPEARSVHYDYIHYKSGWRAEVFEIQKIRFFDVLWVETGNLIAPDDFHRLEFRLAKASLVHARSFGNWPKRGYTEALKRLLYAGPDEIPIRVERSELDQHPGSS